MMTSKQFFRDDDNTDEDYRNVISVNTWFCVHGFLVDEFGMSIDDCIDLIPMGDSKAARIWNEQLDYMPDVPDLFLDIFTLNENGIPLMALKPNTDASDEDISSCRPNEIASRICTYIGSKLNIDLGDVLATDTRATAVKTMAARIKKNVTRDRKENLPKDMPRAFRKAAAMFG